MNSSHLILAMALVCLLGLQLAEAGKNVEACQEMSVLEECKSCCHKESYRQPNKLTSDGKCQCGSYNLTERCRGITDIPDCMTCCRSIDINLARSSIASRIAGECRCRLTLHAYN